MTSRDPTPADPLYLALGRLVVEFSQFVGNMRASIIGLGIGPGRGLIPTLDVLTAEMTADQLRNVFFGVFSAKGKLNDEEKVIRNSLVKRARTLIETRNAIQHAVWFTASRTGTEEPTWETPRGMYDRISHKEPRGLTNKDVLLSIPELEGLADEAREMSILVWNFAQGCRSVDRPNMPRVSGYLQLHDSRVVMRDPILPPETAG